MVSQGVHRLCIPPERIFHRFCKQGFINEGIKDVQGLDTDGRAEATVDVEDGVTAYVTPLSPFQRDPEKQYISRKQNSIRSLQSHQPGRQSIYGARSMAHSW